MNIYVNENSKVNNLNVESAKNNNAQIHNGYANINTANNKSDNLNKSINNGTSVNVKMYNINNMYEKSNENYSIESTYRKDVIENSDDNNKISENEMNMEQMIATLDNMITPESYNQMETLGIIPDDENPELTVGVNRRIQMELSAYCDDYNAPVFNFDSKQLEEVLGSKVFAASVKKAVDVYNMSDSVTATVVANTDGLAVDDVYKAANINKNMKDNANMTSLSENISNQVIGKFDEWGIENSDENMEYATEMINQNIPFTMDNFINYVSFNEAMHMDRASYENMVSDNISKTIYLTGSAKTAQIVGVQYDEEEINEAIKTVSEATDREVYNIIDNNKVLNIKNLEIEKEKTLKELKEKEIETEEHENNTKFIAAKKVIVTARAMMQFESVARAKSMGINIKYKDIADLVDMLIRDEKSYAKTFLESANASVNESNITTFSMSVNAVFEIEKSSVAMIAGVNVHESLDVVTSYATTFTTQYASVVSSYEAVGTQVRTDLGDRIEKAFDNIDELLEGIGLNVDEANTRAVRILGYNNMSITTENVNMIKEKAEQIDYLVENLTPKTVSYLIANDINPMKENIVELNKKLERINEENGFSSEHFAKYLWNLEKNGNISEADRQKFIDMYRSIKRITKMDMRAIGAAIRSEYDFSMEGLEMSYKNRNYAKNSEFVTDNKGYEEFKQSIERGEYTDEAEIDMILSNKVKITPSNIKNTKKLMKQGSKIMEKLMSNATKELKEVVESVLDCDNEKELAQKFEKLENIGAKTVKEMVSGGFSLYSDMESALENNRVLKLMNSYAKSNSYFVPVNMNGSWTSIHLTIKSGTNTSTMHLETTTEMYGEIHLSVAAHRVDDGSTALKGILAYAEDNMGSIEMLKDDFMGRLKDAGIDVLEMTTVNTSTYSEKITVNENIKTESSVLYQTAKIFISTITYHEK